jgi:hypothetical protein
MQMYLYKYLKMFDQPWASRFPSGASRGILVESHLFTTVCKYGVSTLQYTLQNMVEIPSKFQMDF